MRRVAGAVGWAAIFLGSWAPVASAHDGPPFPIIVDRPAGPYIISVWADPDVGTGTFFVILTAGPGKTLPEEHQVTVHVQPTSGRLPVASYECKRQNLRNRVQYHGEVEFDQQEMWQVRVQVRSIGFGEGEVSTEVEATPPGFGPWDLLIYGFPFILFGSLWMFAALRRRFTRPVAE